MTMGSVGRNTVVAFLIIAALFQSANAASLTVGGTTGWTLGISATFYDDWAKSQTFAPGDILVFDYSSTFHNVFEVSAADLASCNVNAPLKTFLSSGGASVPITTAGNHYYICGVQGHCAANMQMSIVVPAGPPASPPTVPLAPAPTKAAPAPAKAAPAPAPSSPAPTPKAPTPSKKAPAPAPAKSPSSAPVVAPSTSSVTAPAPAPKTSKGHQSAGPAMIVGAVLCVVSCFLSL